MANKLQERVYLEWFLKENAIEYLCISESEAPDFYMIQDGNRIGIEVTNIFVEPNPGRKGSKSKRQESLRAQWLRQLSSDYYEKCTIPIAVKINLPYSEELRADMSCEVLTVLLRSVEIAAWEWKTYELDCDGRGVEMHVQRLPNIADFDRYSRWTCITDHSGWVAAVSKEHINNALRKKQKKLRRYSMNCDEVWLLLVVDRSWKSGKLDLNGSQFALKNTAFGSVWLLEYPIKTHRLS